MESYEACEVLKGGLRGILSEHSSLWDFGKGDKKLRQAVVSHLLSLEPYLSLR